MMRTLFQPCAVCKRPARLPEKHCEEHRVGKVKKRRSTKKGVK